MDRCESRGAALDTTSSILILALSALSLRLQAHWEKVKQSGEKVWPSNGKSRFGFWLSGLRLNELADPGQGRSSKAPSNHRWRQQQLREHAAAVNSRALLISAVWALLDEPSVAV